MGENAADSPCTPPKHAHAICDQTAGPKDSAPDLSVAENLKAMKTMMTGSTQEPKKKKQKTNNESSTDDDTPVKKSKKKGKPPSPKSSKKHVKAKPNSDIKVKKVKKQLATTKNSVPKLPFPGRPKAKKAPQTFGTFKIYTDLTAQKWRVQKQGDKQDTGCSFKIDPKAGWCKVLQVLAGTN